MTYEMYRETTLGIALIALLNEYIDNLMLTPKQATAILTAFDWQINKTLADRKKNRCPIFFTSEKLVTYRYYDDVWSFVIKNVQFRDVNHEPMQFAETVKVVACDCNYSTFHQ